MTITAEELARDKERANYHIAGYGNEIGMLAGSTLKYIAEVERLQAERFTPLGDNHHNAALCPYCSPKIRAELDRYSAAADKMRADKDAEIARLKERLRELAR